MLTVHEITRDDGSLSPVGLTLSDGALALVEEGATLALPAGALEKVMARFGAPLEDESRVHDVDALDLPGGARLRRVRHKGFYDVIAKDYLVLHADGGEALCALATTVAGALSHVAQAYARACRAEPAP